MLLPYQAIGTYPRVIYLRLCFFTTPPITRIEAVSKYSFCGFEILTNVSYHFPRRHRQINKKPLIQPLDYCQPTGLL